MTPKVRKAELSFLYMSCRLVLFYISTTYHKNIPKGLWLTEQTQNLFQIKQRVITPKRMKARVVNLVCDMSSHPDLHFYQVSSKYSKGIQVTERTRSFMPMPTLTSTPTGSVPKTICPPTHFGRGGHKYGMYANNIIITRTVNILTTNKLLKLTML